MNFLRWLKSFYDSGNSEFEIKLSDYAENCITLDLKLEETPKVIISRPGQNLEMDLNSRNERVSKILNLWGNVIKREQKKYVESSDYYQGLPFSVGPSTVNIFSATGKAQREGKKGVMVMVDKSFEIRPLVTSSVLACGEEAFISGHFGYKYGFSTFPVQRIYGDDGNWSDFRRGTPLNYQVLMLGARFTGTVRCSKECCGSVSRKPLQDGVPQRNHLASFCTNYPHNCGREEERRAPRLYVSFDLEKLKKQLGERMVQQPWQPSFAQDIYNIYATGNDTIHETVDIKFNLKGQEIVGSGTMFYYPKSLPRFPQFGGYHAYAVVQIPGSDRYADLYQGVIKNIKVEVSMGGYSLGSFFMDLDFDHQTHCDIEPYTDTPPWTHVLLGQ